MVKKCPRCNSKNIHKNPTQNNTKQYHCKNCAHIWIAKRSTKDEPIFLKPELFHELAEMVQNIKWPYTSDLKESLWLRDQAFASLIIMSGLRTSEALNLQLKQFYNDKKKILLQSVVTLKNGDTRNQIVLPKRGNFAPFTQHVENWLNHLEGKNGDCYVFPTASKKQFLYSQPLGRKRAHWIIKTTTGKFTHWYRAICETIYGRQIFKGDAWKLAQFMGLKRLDSTKPYVQSSWEDDIKHIYNL
jgi:integrase